MFRERKSVIAVRRPFLFWARVSDARIDLYLFRSFQPPFLNKFFDTLTTRKPFTTCGRKNQTPSSKHLSLIRFL
nr:MAG TPA: hypothetical protein [Caudoviricetes sp.]